MRTEDFIRPTRSQNFTSLVTFSQKKTVSAKKKQSKLRKRKTKDPEDSYLMQERKMKKIPKIMIKVNSNITAI